MNRTKTVCYNGEHTCSEISYRISDVECITRAKTIQLKLTGMVGGFEVRNLSEEILSTSLPEDSSSSDAAFPIVKIIE